MTSAIYKFFTVADETDKVNIIYKCNECNKDYRTVRGTSSNLIKHFDKTDHAKVKEDYLKLHAEFEKLQLTKRNKRQTKLFTHNQPDSPLLSSVGVTCTKSSNVQRFVKLIGQFCDHCI